MINTCVVAVPSIIKQEDTNNGTNVIVNIENIRNRWYEVFVVTGGAVTSNKTSFLIGPSEYTSVTLQTFSRKGFSNREIELNSMVTGDTISLHINGDTQLAHAMHGLDIIVLALTGSPIPDKLLDGGVEALNADDAVLEDIYNKQYSLNEFTDPSTFKSYSELNLKLTRVLGEDAGTSQEKSAMAESVDDSPFNGKSRYTKFTSPVTRIL